ncbi:hypothetical protein NMY22_g11182 [Coprinellus aureogranulatus]|nr:hypothetical protein NMY22_g11182 [Coprinellus aureogranulatus]
MDDAENEVLDWENEDDEQQHQHGGDPRRQSLADVDADDVVSLGDEDEQPSTLEEPKSQSKPIPQIYNADADRSYRDQERSYSRETFRAPQKEDQNRSERRAPRQSDRRQRSGRGSPPRTQSTLPPPPPRLTHALPPKPVLAAAPPAARPRTSDSHTRTISSSSPAYESTKKDHQCYRMGKPYLEYGLDVLLQYGHL